MRTVTRLAPLSFALAFCVVVFAASSTSFVGTGVDDSTVGTLAWSVPENILVEDGVIAFAGTTGEEISTHYLKGTNCGFAIPAGATIDGIVVEIKKQWLNNDTPASDPAITDNAVRLVKADGSITAVGESSPSSWPAALTWESYGGATEKWGETWTATDINDADFGVAVSAFIENFTGGDNVRAQVDAIKITVHYTAASGTSSATTMLIGSN